ncbi:MAG: exodeoxyribonuclease VII small subunit [Wenzhouxiangella sp.]|jgi:exodeoxyribonuclease VII small subunit|nr:exodeoxyribonuclease VII small subunit [Wenzhouxiangella sp.]
MTKSDQAETTKEQLPDFESSLKELEELVEKLENDELSLQDSLRQFERGISLSRHCHSMLESARQQVSVLTEPGNPDSEIPFSGSATEETP